MIDPAPITEQEELRLRMLDTSLPTSERLDASDRLGELQGDFDREPVEEGNS